jgi:leucyl-tRNA synthetase
LRRGDGGEVQALRETNTMPGYAGSSWYFLRYMDPHNDKEFCNRKASDYWNQVDLYIGGTEHAVGHLLYSRLWTKALYDLGYIGYDEPYKKLVNQGMIQGVSSIIYRLNEDGKFYSKNIFKKNTDQRLIELSKQTELPDWEKRVFFQPVHIDVNVVNNNVLNIELLKTNYPKFAEATFVTEDDGTFICDFEVEKMSKSKLNVVNPDDIVNKYGADTFRMYEMFLGPVEMSKPWDTKGIEGVHRFLKKLWRLFYLPAEASAQASDEIKGKVWTDEKATDAELKVLHHTIKKIENDTERFSFNTGVSAFMIAVNELNDLKCHKKEILEPLLILLAPYAPHIAEELYHHLQGAAKAPSLGGGLGEVSILDASYPKLEQKYLVESSKEYPVSVNGKLRTTINIALGAAESEVEQIVLANEVIKKWLEGKQPKKIIYKEGKMVNVVV